MRLIILSALTLAAVLPAIGQSGANSAPTLPKDPRAVFAAAAPLYDFSSPDLKPWHMKASYQLYDQDGKPTEQGTFEYWWASPTVNRSTWTRTGAEQTIWRNAKGSYVQTGAKGTIGYYDYKLEKALLSPLPSAADLDSQKSRLQSKAVSSNGVDLDCLMVVPETLPKHVGTSIPMGLFPTYCFDAQLSELIASYSFGSITNQFNAVVKTQERYLAKQVVISEKGHMVLSAIVDTIDGISTPDAVITPPPGALHFPPSLSKAIGEDALHFSSVKPSDFEGLMRVIVDGNAFSKGMLIKKTMPVYPLAARAERLQGVVVLHATIGKDGQVHDLRMISAPSVSLLEASIAAVSTWEYKPYLLNGKPVEVETTVNVVFSLGQ